MWTYEYSREGVADPEKVWQNWADVAAWPEWNLDLARAELTGPFAVGSRIVMTQLDPAEDPIELRIATLEEGREFTDLAEGPGVVVRTIHRVEDLGDGRVRVTYRTEIDGAAGPELGPLVTHDFPEVVQAIIDRSKN
jgi:uncharacterized protein YndB with AHSA1/START domain